MLGVFPALVASLMLQAAPQEQDPTAVDQIEVVDGVVKIDDVVVTGQRLDDFIRDFVGEVANPAGARRGLARWHDKVCVGALNMSSNHARFLVDRISQVAMRVGLAPGEPGCDPQIIVFAVRDGDSLARELVASRGRIFQVGHVAELNSGRQGLEQFLNPGRPVRWWLTSVPKDARTGQVTVRVGGEGETKLAEGLDTTASGLPPIPVVNGIDASLLRRATRDDLTRAIVIIDVTRLENASFEQVADYVAMISLAQIDPDANTLTYPTILNLFADDDFGASGLTEWDMTYLNALYNVTLNQVAPGAQVRSIAADMERVRQRGDISQPSD